jgi:N-acetylglucosamine-6-phosphate deacetylase
MSRQWLHDLVLLDPEQPEPCAGSLLLEAERIVAVLRAGDRAPDDAEPVSLGGARLAPGLIDVHFHGALPTARPFDALRALRRASASLARHGVTAFLATTIAWPAIELRSRVEELVAALDAGDWPGAVPIGIHLEGPWIRDQAAGAHPRDAIRPYDADEGAVLFDRAGAALRLVTLAPELHGARQLEAELGRRGVAIALGHTLAGAEAVAASVASGACHVTHLFNAMGSTPHRTPIAGGVAATGFAALALADDRLSCDLIADGAHVHPDWLRHAAAAKGARTILISDHIDADDAGAGLGGQPLHSDGAAWRLPDGRLAGSHLMLDDAIRNAERWRVMSVHDAARACTAGPARLLGIERERGTLRPGARADLVAFAPDGSVARTWIGGRTFAAG